MLTEKRMARKSDLKKRIQFYRSQGALDIGHSDLEIVEWPKVAPDRDLTSIRIPSYKDAARDPAG
jgi:hypothetical protein